jgi:molybdate transport system substrate-binding protein
MLRAMQKMLAIFLVAIGTTSVAAAQVNTLATMAVEGPLRALEQAYQQSGQSIRVTFDTSPNITKRLASGEMPDVLIAQTSTIDQMIKDGKALGDSRTPVGKIAVGVAMSPHGRRPDISSVEALKNSILAADAVVYSQGASGLLVEKMLSDLGIADRVKGKVARLATGGDVMHRIGTSHGNEIGFTMVSEIKLGESHGGKLVGPLPAAVRTYTAYDVVVMKSAKAPDAGRAFVRAITSPSAKTVLAANGWEF